MLVTLNDVLHDAQKNRYAVGLFNTVNLEMAKGVLKAAADMKSPVIIGTAEVLLKYSSLEELAPMLASLAESAPVPVVLHLDHGLTSECVKHAIELGFTSVMYDCSTLPYSENVKAVAETVKLAHSRGITVEGELGHVGSAADQNGDTDIYTSVSSAADFASATNVDALAIAIGTAHGVYKSKPKLDFTRLDEIAAAISAPLVLHGGSGLTDEDFKRAIEGGIAKINIFTDINNAAAKAAHDAYSEGRGMTLLMPEIVDAVYRATVEKLKLFGCCGRA